jgi:hypothetical protein
VTIATVDAENRRAWIGGVLTKSSSTDPEVGLFAGRRRLVPGAGLTPRSSWRWKAKPKWQSHLS